MRREPTSNPPASQVPCIATGCASENCAVHNCFLPIETVEPEPLRKARPPLTAFYLHTLHTPWVMMVAFHPALVPLLFQSAQYCPAIGSPGVWRCVLNTLPPPVANCSRYYVELLRKCSVFVLCDLCVIKPIHLYWIRPPVSGSTDYMEMQRKVSFCSNRAASAANEGTQIEAASHPHPVVLLLIRRL